VHLQRGGALEDSDTVAQTALVGRLVGGAGEEVGGRGRVGGDYRREDGLVVEVGKVQGYDAG
jgi:hypothetical protein